MFLILFSLKERLVSSAKCMGCDYRSELRTVKKRYVEEPSGFDSVDPR